MDILLNGKPRLLAGPITVLQLLQADELDVRRVAVELNEELCPVASIRLSSCSPVTG